MAISTILLITSIVLDTISLAGDDWLAARIVWRSINGTSSSTMAGSVTTGVFHGRRAIDYGLGERVVGFAVHDELAAGASYYSTGAWLGIVLFALIAIMLAIVGTLFALVNTILTPVSSMAGARGMFVWSSGALCSSLLSAMFFGLQYATASPSRLLHAEHIDDGLTTDGQMRVGASYYMFMGAIAFDLTTVAVLYVTQSGVLDCEKEVPGGGTVHDPCVIMY